jgi:hypothetical protein
MPGQRDLMIYRGATFNMVLRWENMPYVYAAITGVAQAAPARITAVGHGLVNGWRAAVVSVLGMVEINAENVPPKNKDYHQVTVVDANTVTLNDVNAAGFTPYQSGGYLQYLTPVPLTGYTAKMSIKDQIDGLELLRLDTTNGRIVIDPTALTITLTILPADTAALMWMNGVYDLDMVSPTGVLTPLLAGSVQVIKDVTTT